MQREIVRIKSSKIVTLLSLTHISCNFLCMPPPLLLFLTHTHMVIAHADGSIVTSGNSWSCGHICSILGGDRVGFCCFHTDPPLHIFTFQSTAATQQPKSYTSGALVPSPYSDGAVYYARPRGTNVCSNHILYTLTRIVSFSLFSSSCDFVDFSSFCSFIFLISVPLISFPSFSFSSPTLIICPHIIKVAGDS